MPGEKLTVFPKHPLGGYDNLEWQVVAWKKNIGHGGNGFEFS